MKLLTKKIQLLWTSGITAKAALILLSTWIFVGLSADFLAGNLPIIAQTNGKINSPIIDQYLNINSKSDNIKNWNKIDYEWKVSPIIPFTPNNIDYNYNEKTSKKNLHLLGTYSNGKDLLSGLIHGARWSLIIAFCSTLIAFLLGSSLGLVSGYFGNNSLRIPVTCLSLYLLFFPLVAFECKEIFSWINDYKSLDGTAYFLTGLLLGLTAIIFPAWLSHKTSSLFHKFLNPAKDIYLPIDSMIQKVVEFKISIPYLLFIIAFSTLFRKPSTYEVILIIGLSGWTGIARLIRAETLKTKSLNFVEAAIAGGLPRHKVIFRHIFPNAASPAFAATSFVFVGSIITEGLLSFLGLIPHGKPSWGQILAGSKANPSILLPAILPGLAILLVLLSIQTITEKLSRGQISQDLRNIL